MILFLFPFRVDNNIIGRFGGPIGALAMIIFLPALLLLFAYGCDENGYDAFHRLYAFGQRVADGQVSLSDVYNAILSWNPSTLLFYFGFVAQLVTFSTAMPGETIEGLPLRDGTRLKYKVNGMSTCCPGDIRISNRLLLLSCSLVRRADGSHDYYDVQQGTRFPSSSLGI